MRENRAIFLLTSLVSSFPYQILVPFYVLSMYERDLSIFMVPKKKSDNMFTCKDAIQIQLKNTNNRVV